MEAQPDLGDVAYYADSKAFAKGPIIDAESNSGGLGLGFTGSSVMPTVPMPLKQFVPRWSGNSSIRALGGQDDIRHRQGLQAALSKWESKPCTHMRLWVHILMPGLND